jgi:hypothetical protein
MHVGYWWEIQKDKNHLEDVDVDGRIILKCMIKKYIMVVGTRFIRLRVERRI